MTEYEKDINDLKEQILKDGNTLVSKRDLVERFCEIDKEYNGEPWNLLQILANINVLIGEEPCEDVVGRQAVLKEIPKLWNSNGDKDYCMETLRDFVTELPPVVPTRKKGKWINKSHTSGCGIKFVASECTCCGKKTFFDCDQLVYNYCPNCGAEMKGEET